MTEREGPLRGPLRPGIARGIIFSQRALMWSAGTFPVLCFIAIIFANHSRPPRGPITQNWVVVICSGILIVDLTILAGSLLALVLIIVFFVVRYTIRQILTVIILADVFVTVAVAVPEFRTGALASLLGLATLVVVFVLNQYPAQQELQSALIRRSEG